MIHDIQNVQDMVFHILEDVPATRDDDMLLILHVWKRQGLDLPEFYLEEIRKCANPESIRRVRQKIQEGGQLLGTERVRRARHAEQEPVKDWTKGLL